MICVAWKEPKEDRETRQADSTQFHCRRGETLNYGQTEKRENREKM